MKLIDLFSGIGGFSLGFQRAGYQFTEHYFSEIDKSAIANYKKTFQMPNTSETLQLFSPQTLQEQILSLSDRLAKISALLERVPDSQAQKVALSSTQLPSLLTSDQVFLSGRTLKALSAQMLAQTFGRLSKRLPTLGIIQSNGNCLIQAGYSPKIESEYTLSDILQDEVSQEYFLSQKMIAFLQQKRKVNHKPKLVPHSKPMAI